MQKLKSFIVSHVSKNCLAYLILVFRYHRKNKSIFKTLFFAIKALFKFYTPNGNLNKGEQLKELFGRVNINVDDKYSFVYNIDIFKTIHRTKQVMDNISIDYQRVLNESLIDMYERINRLSNSMYKENELNTIEAINLYVDREIKSIENSKRSDKEEICLYLKNIKEGYPKSFKEAIQRILFFNQLLWQCGHGLEGLGKLDRILYRYYDEDIKKKRLTREKAKILIKDMLLVLHGNYWWKSSVLLGDTGQIIVLGGKENEKKYFCHELTYLFIEAIKELHIPDPKVLLRVCNEVPNDLMRLSLETIKTGIGCPLFSNDEVIIPKLISFGINKKDVYNYVTSACWEPLIVGYSVAQNNIDSLVFINPLNKLLVKEKLSNINSFSDFLSLYKKYLKEYLLDFTSTINKIEWEETPIISLFTCDCDSKSEDVSVGGAKYNHYGVTGVSLGNTVNSLYNIKKYVFELKKYKLDELNNYRMNNFNNAEDVLNELKNESVRFGTDDDNIINLTNEITGYTDEIISIIDNRLGGKFKFGYSAPTYIIKSIDEPASLDGRKNGEPFLVHISSDKSNLAYTELLHFASQLKYDGHRFNGNVVDFMINPSFIENNFNKMLDFLILSIKLGFFQMQMNVISSDTLIKAKNNPQDYTGLIVRVWGFSAYFNDLPVEYKDLLIRRALESENKL